MEFIAHRSEDGDRIQTIENHLENVANLAKKFAEVFAPELASQIGLLHDIGKYSTEFQERINGKNIMVDHSTAGGQYALSLSNANAKNYAVAYCVMGHHSGLPNGGTENDKNNVDLPTLIARKNRVIPQYKDNYINNNSNNPEKNSENNNENDNSNNYKNDNANNREKNNVNNNSNNNSNSPENNYINNNENDNSNNYINNNSNNPEKNNVNNNENDNLNNSENNVINNHINNDENSHENNSANNSAKNAENKISLPTEFSSPNSAANPQSAFELSVLIRMLFSSLVDADWLDTEAFMQNGAVDRRVKATIAELWTTLGNKIKGYVSPEGGASDLNKRRSKILNYCLEEAENRSENLFSLTAPTGSGKTISSLAFALKHAYLNNKSRIIYVVPYNTIIEQNAKVFEDLLGEENVLQHHNNIDYGTTQTHNNVGCGTMQTRNNADYGATQTRNNADCGTMQTRNNADCGAGDNEVNIKKQLATENWDYPIIVTSAVQFFESLFSASPSKCRKLHNIANSVIVFDEAQMIPQGYLKPCAAIIRSLIDRFSCTAVLATATQANLEKYIGKKPTEIVKDISILFEAFKRCSIEICKEEMTADELVENLSAQNQVLCIVNTRKGAQELFSKLSKFSDDCVHALPTTSFDNCVYTFTTTSSDGEVCPLSTTSFDDGVCHLPTASPCDGVFHLSTTMYPKHRSETLRTIRERLRKGEVCRVISTSLIEAGVDVDFPIVFREEAGLDSIIQSAGRCNREGRNDLSASKVIVFALSDSKPPNSIKPNIGAAKSVLSGNSGRDLLSAEVITEYFAQLFYNIGDAKLDVKQICNKIDGAKRSCLYPFRDIAADFRIIEQDTKTIYVLPQMLTQACDLMRRIDNGERSRKLFHELGQFGVSLYGNDIDRLKQANCLVEKDEEICILAEGVYDEKVGVSLAGGNNATIIV